MKARWAAEVRCVILTHVKRGDERRGESIEGGKNAAPLLCLSCCRRRLTVDLAPATSHQTLCATETNVALCWMSFPHYGSNGPEMAPECVSVCECVVVVVATHDQFQFLCLVDFFFSFHTLEQSTSCAQHRSFFLYRELTTFCQRRKWPVQCEFHFKSFPVNVPSILSVLLTSLPPSASPHTPSSSISSSFSSSSADNPMGHSRRTEAVWRCSERGLLQVSTSDSTRRLLQLLEHYLNRFMMEHKNPQPFKAFCLFKKKKNIYIFIAHDT